ncbi:MAG TPA: dihydrolipoyllysine-residue acetyltransferase [Casimicrobiaceae bacterium]|nr:dihydrolipoyllysine-residue acetyltransferase [Casimicrobiaceae bacterium]
MALQEVRVPDIGDFEDVPIIEILVKPGDTVSAEDSLVTLESDKATMDVPSPAAGLVKELRVKVGDKVKQGSPLLTIESGSNGAQTDQAKNAVASVPPSPPATRAEATPKPRGEKGLADAPGEGSSASPPPGASTEVKVPDIGDFSDVPVIEIFVKAGDIVKVDDPLVTLESDKAAMDVPSPVAGAVQGVRVSVGDRVSEGTVIATVAATAGAGAPSTQTEAAGPATAKTAETTKAPDKPAAASMPSTAPRAQAQPSAPVDEAKFKAAHASPSVRKFARELGVDLGNVNGSGPHGRIVQQDVQAYVKQTLAAPPIVSAPSTTSAGGLNLLPWPKVDFAKFGAVETKPLSRIKKISGQNLARNWVMVPHVTQFDEADITELEALRVTLNKEHEKAGVKFTMLAFLIKASVAALRKFPDVNASLDGENLVYKKYFNIGFAADTPNGLVVPVVKNADQKGLVDIAKEMADLSAKARDGKLGPADMQGGCFSISSLGGIGGTAFTPIVNAPEVAILGVSKSAMKPVWDGKAFAPKLMLPLSLSYDHRVIDGAAAARFTAYLAQLLADFRRVVL